MNIYSLYLLLFDCYSYAIMNPYPLYHPGMYTGRLGDWYTSLGAQTLTPKYHFSSFVLSVVFQQKRR